MTKRHRYSPEVTFEETLFISAEDEDVLHTDTCDACGHHGAESVPKTGAHWVLFDSDLSLYKNLSFLRHLMTLGALKTVSG